MGERVLVTGGAGFIGSYLVDALFEAGHQVRVFDNLEPQVHGALRGREEWPDYLSTSSRHRLANECEKILGEVRHRDALRKAMDGVDVIFHQAAVVGVGQSMYEVERYVDANTHGTAVLLDLLANEGYFPPGPGFEIYNLPRKEFDDFLAQRGEKLLKFRDPWHGRFEIYAIRWD